MQKTDDPNESAKPGGDDSRCNCTYRIIDITVPEHNSSSLDTRIEFFGSTACPPTGIPSTSCPHISKYHEATGVCPLSINNSLCITPFDDLTPDPYEFFPFNCDVPRNTVGNPINFAYYEYPFNCNSLNSVSTSSNTVSITFEIVCNETQPDPDCLGGGGYGFSSGAVTLTIPTGGIDAMTPPFQLGGSCGCTPIF